jgi:hypothetical protein
VNEDNEALVHTPTLDELASPLTYKEIVQIETLGIPIEDAEQLSALFPEIPQKAVEKQTTRNRIRDIFLIPKKLQKWRRKH